MKINKVIISCVFCAVISINFCFVQAMQDFEKVNIYTNSNSGIVKPSTYENIKKVMFMISENLKDIDFKLDKARITEEYEKYPLIRLNIDSPYFGLTNIVESKLKVKNEVSTLDIARGYNLRSMINSKTILVENMEVTSIVVTTKQIKISDKMTQKDAEICLEKLFEYLNQVKSASNFLDIQLKNTFDNYYSEDKKMNIMYIKNEIKNMNSTLKEIEDKIMKMNLVTSNDMSSNIQKCKEYRIKINEFKDLVNNPLSENEQLQNAVSNIIYCKNELIQFSKEVGDIVLVDENFEINLVLKNTIINMDENINFLKSIVYDKQVNLEYEENNYSSFSNKYLSSVQKYRDELSDILSQGKFNNQENYTLEQLNIEFSKIYDVYLKFLNSYNIALTQYIKLQITDIKEEGIFYTNMSDDLIYIYSSIEDELVNIASTFDKSSMYSNVESIEKLELIASKVYEINSNMLGE